MVIQILIILCCVPLYVANSFCDKYISSRDDSRKNSVYNQMKFLICFLVLLPMFALDAAPKMQAGAIGCGVMCGVMYAISKSIILKGYEKTSVAFMTLCHASGMIIPCIIGHYAWNEKLNLLSGIGICIVILAIVMLKDNKSEQNKMEWQGVVIGIIVFITSGGVMIAQKWMGLYFADESVTAYNVYSFIVAFLLLACCEKTKRVTKKEVKAVCLPALGSGLSLCIISVVMTALAGKVPSIILFPLFNGLGIIFVCVSSVFVFHEKLNRKKAVGLLMGVIGLCMINAR